jgi:hypothetical protein
MRVKPNTDPSAPDATDRPRWGLGAGILLAFLLLAAMGIGRVLVHPDRVLDFNDGNIESVLSPTFACPGAILRVWDNQFFFGQGGKLFSLSSASIGESLMGPHHYRRIFVALLVALAGAGVYWMLRQFRISRAASALAAGAVMLGGTCYTFAVLGLMVRAGALGFAALATGFLERGRRDDSWIPYALGGGCLGLALSEVPDIGVFLAVATAGIWLWTHWPEQVAGAPWPKLAGRFALYVACSGLLAWQTIGVMFATQVQGVQQGVAEDRAERYAWATQWSLPPEEAWNLVSGTYFGTTSRSADAPYRGRMGRSPGWETTRQGFRNFSLTGHHLGVVPSILLLTAIAVALAGPRDRRRLAWLVVAGGAISLALAMGKFTPLYRVVFSLPYFSTIRNPEKWMVPFVLFAALGIALALDALRNPAGEESRRVRRGALQACAAIGGLAILLLFATAAGRSGFLAQLQAEGYGDQAATAWSAAVTACLKTAAIAGVFALAVVAMSRPVSLSYARRAALLTAAAGVLTGLDLLAVNGHYVAGRTYGYVLAANPLRQFIDSHRTEGRFKTLPPEHPALNNIRMSHLQVSGCDLFDPVSVSRLPTDYAALFDALKTQPMRLWELGAVRYFVTLPGGAQQLEQADGARGRVNEVFAAGIAQQDNGLVPIADAPPQQQVLRIAEFTGARPKIAFATRVTAVPATAEGEKAALARLAAPDFDAAGEAVVHADPAPPAAPPGAKVLRTLRDEPAEAAVEVETPAQGLLVRATKFDPDWKVRIDGAPAPLLRVNSLFQGVPVPAGRHTVDFEYRPDRSSLVVAAAGRLGWLGLWLVWLVRRRRP